MNDWPSSEFPELFFGVAAPIGTDIESVVDSLSQRLTFLKYTPQIVKITNVMLEIDSQYLPPQLLSLKKEARGFFDETMLKIDFANKLCSVLEDPAIMAKIAIDEIQALRAKITGNAAQEAQKHAFIIRQLKRPDEVRLLREVYGPRFFLISAFSPREVRSKALREKIRIGRSTRTDETEISNLVETLLNRDYHEESGSFGQQIRETYHLADVFVDVRDRTIMQNTIMRFLDLLFGRNDISPTKSEYGMYAAKSASLRSADLSRQVGAAIFSDDGELITQGCNEVPKAFGGTYWDDDSVDYRDIKLEFDPNERQKREIVRDILGRLDDAGLLIKPDIDHQSGTVYKSVDDLAEKIISKPTKTRSSTTNDKIIGCLRDAFVMDLTEYGRVVHAEMVAICDAARLGRSIKGSTLFCTTFPCHNCAKHILASGIKKVVYIEPYPKSKAQELHDNEVELDKLSNTKVSFLPFTGISPRRYRNLFEKGRRKDDKGKAIEWQNLSASGPRPNLESTTPTYIQLEDLVIVSLEKRKQV